MYKITSLLLILCMLLCAPALSAQTQASNRPVAWKQEDLSGLVMNLDDPNEVEWLQFLDDGHVSITMGYKNGAVTAPVFQWRIVDGKLQIISKDIRGPGKDVYDELTLISRDASVVIARRLSGETARYNIPKPQSPADKSDPYYAALSPHSDTSGVRDGYGSGEMKWYPRYKHPDGSYTYDFAAGVKNMRERAQKGDADAQSKLGVIYYQGAAGQKEDHKEAVTFLLLAAKQGDPDAQQLMGELYRNGDGVSKDAKQSVKWLRAAAEQGFVFAQMELADMIHTDAAVRDDAEAYFWASLGNKFSLGTDNRNQMVAEIEKTLPSEKIAILRKRISDWKPEAAMIPSAQIFYAGLCQEGLEVPKDDLEAYFWYRVAQKGSDNAYSDRAAEFESPLGTEQKVAADARVAEWFKNHPAPAPKP